MSKAQLLENLEALIANMPDLEQYLPTSKEHALWLAATHDQLRRWRPSAAHKYKRAADMLILHATRPIYIQEMEEILTQAVTDLGQR